MIDPRTQYILYQERQNELMAEIERKLGAQERRGARETGGSRNIPQNWLKAFFNRSLHKPA